MSLIDPLLLTAEEDTRLAIADILARFPELDAQRSGTLVNTIAGVIALTKRDAQRHALRQVAKTFFQTARAQDLDTLANDHLQLQRAPATTAIGHILLVRPNATQDTTVSAGTTFLDPQGHLYTVTTDTPVTSHSARIPVHAAQPGPTGNRPANTVFTLQDNLTLPLDGSASYNPEPIAGGNPSETDDQFRERIARWWRALRRATPQAIEYAALSVPTIRRAVVDETHARPERGGWVDLYVTDANDLFNSILLDDVRDAVDRDARAAGVLVNVHGAHVVHVTIRLKLTQKAGGPASAPARAANAVRNHVNTLPIGAPLHRAQIAAVATAADSSLLNAHVLQPIADLVPTNQQVLRTTADLVTIE